MLDQKTQVRINRFIQNMPPLPISVSKILEIAKDPTADAKKLNEVISIDPVLTGKVLKLINSAYYALPNQITSIVRAIIMLGINTVKNLALSTAVISTIKKDSNFQALDMDAFWRHSICVGVIAKEFAKKLGVDNYAPALIEAVEEIEAILAQITQNYPIGTEEQQQAAAQQACIELEQKSAIKNKLIKASKTFGNAALIEATKDPIKKVLTQKLLAQLEPER
jgi:c-di-GMP-related signal transduction protein